MIFAFSGLDMEFEQIKRYWDERASHDDTAQSTTQDFYLRDIEFGVIKEAIFTHKPTSVLDIGCGDARTTARLASTFANLRFFGVDYSESMIKNAKRNIDNAGINNLLVHSGDVTGSLSIDKLDMAYTTRCLINLPDWELQCIAIDNIAKTLRSGGIYVMIENFVHGHDNFNQVRATLDLPAIPIRDHNLYFDKRKLESFLFDRFDIIDDKNISSTYYLISRVIYSKLCQDTGTTPDYFDPHHKYAAQMPFCGEFGPVRMLMLKKR